jgi:hypothetical protein
MSEKELALIESNVSRLPGGRWYSYLGKESACVHTESGGRGDVVAVCYAAVPTVTRAQQAATAAFIANARENVPALVAEVRRLRSILAAREAG